MAENKTKSTAASPDAYIAAIVDDARRNDCAALIALMSKVTKLPAVMWGTAIVGFGVHKYDLSGGKVGEICAVGFSSRKNDITIYGVVGVSGADELLPSLGNHKLGKGCLYVSQLADVDAKVLEKMIARAFKAKGG